jgi:hypothetical protein
MNNIPNIEYALKWANVTEDHVELLLKRSSSMTKAPLVETPVSTLKQIENHFSCHRTIDFNTLSLYESLLQLPRDEILSFLVAVDRGITEELFYEMPTELISSMKGRPCRTRDHEETLPTSPEIDSFAKIPATLVCDNKDTILYVRGIEVCRIQISGLLAPIPTTSTLEQFVIVCKPSGECALISTTRKNLLIQAEFKLDCQDNDVIDWIEVINWHGKTLVFWGGTDALRGQVKWSFSTGLNTAAIDDENQSIFFDIPDSDIYIEECYKSALVEQDFSLHGNILTLWKKYVDSEKNGCREWKTSSSLHVGSRIYSIESFKNACSDSEDVWGTPQQFITVGDGEVRTYLWQAGTLIRRGHFKCSQYSLRACVLYAHSR